MERTDAERVFALISDINGDLRGKVVSERWWLVWIVIGIEIMITSTVTQLIFWQGEARIFPYLLLWSIHVALIPPIIFFIHRRGGGQRTATETYIWWIWTTFIIGAICVPLFNTIVGLPILLTYPIVALLAALSFSTMAMVTHRFFLICALFFLGVIVAMSLSYQIQSLIFGLADRAFGDGDLFPFNACTSSGKTSVSNAIHRLPITMKTVFQDLLLLTFAVPPEGLAAQLPTCIHPYVRDNRSYISIVIGNMRGMRVAVLPAFLGTNYYQIVYRAVVCLRDTTGKEHPGVFFLRSDSNDSVMSYFGNRLTEFRFHYFHTGAISLIQRQQELLVSVETSDKQGDLVAYLRDCGPAEALASIEGFASVTDEKNTLIQLFHAYSYDENRDMVYDLEIERGEWHIQRLEMIDYFSAFFMEQPFVRSQAQPVSHVYIKECDYIWKPMVEIPAAGLMRRKAGT